MTIRNQFSGSLLVAQVDAAAFPERGVGDDLDTAKDRSAGEEPRGSGSSSGRP